MKTPLAVAITFLSLGFVLGFGARGNRPPALAAFAAGNRVAARGVAGGGKAPTCSARNGDVDADGSINLGDAVTILRYLFLGSPAELLPFCARPVDSPGVPEPGQSVCYELTDDEGWVEAACDVAACEGQDATYATGCPIEGRFVENGDGTVTDDCTGLMWQKDTADVDRNGESSDQDFAQWCDALAYCEGLTFAGHDDWRLPNVRELQSIVDYGRFDPTIDPAFRSLATVYWASTSSALTPSRGWGVYFYNGFVINDARDMYYFVRAVRNAR